MSDLVFEPVLKPFELIDASTATFGVRQVLILIVGSAKCHIRSPRHAGDRSNNRQLLGATQDILAPISGRAALFVFLTPLDASLFFKSMPSRSVRIDRHLQV